MNPPANQQPTDFSAGGNFIHYDPVRIDYSISDAELAQLENCSNNIWKDFFLGCWGIGVPCLINAAADIKKTATFAPTLGLILNLVIGVIGAILGLAFLIAWRRSKSDATRIISSIKAKPRIQIKT